MNVQKEAVMSQRQIHVDQGIAIKMEIAKTDVLNFAQIQIILVIRMIHIIVKKENVLIEFLIIAKKIHVVVDIVMQKIISV
jgi:hypothetical protein